MDREEILKYLQQKYPEDLNENYRCYWWYTSNIDGSALTYYLVLHDKFCEWVNTGMYRDPMQLANHEMNHYTDYIISRNIDTSVNNNMLKQLENSLKQTDATDYYRKGTEQKAYMNQLRTILKQNGEIQNLDEPVSSALLKKYLDKMPDSDPIKKMSKQHKNIKTYTKWFNTIPLLGTATLGINTYFNNKENKQ